MIQALGREWNINPISWGDRRKLHRIHSQIYITSLINKDNSIDWEKYWDAIEFSLSVAFDDVEKELNGLTDSDIDSLGQKLMNHYLAMEKKENGDFV
jgi:ADP-dependent phosphofructokinase/glucokinase